MAEFVLYHGEVIKLGTIETLYNVSYDKYSAFAREKHWPWDIELVSTYLKVESGFQFRFPFPDEDKLKFGEIITPFDRTVDISIDSSVYNRILGEGGDNGILSIGIALQKPIFRKSDGQFCLAMIFKDHLTGKLFAIEDPRDVKLIARQIVKHHISSEQVPQKKTFYRQIASRILKGYRVGLVLINKQDIQEKRYEFLDTGTKENNAQNDMGNQKDKNIDKTEDKLAERSRKKGKGMGK